MANDRPSPTEEHKILFINLIVMLSSSAMQQLGKLKNPMTGKVEVSLEGAQATIDLLEMLKAKTAGNLDRDESRLLTDTLSMLQMNYVETAPSQPAETKPEAKPPAEAEAPQATAESSAKPQEKKPDADGGGKFHKSYG